MKTELLQIARIFRHWKYVYNVSKDDKFSQTRMSATIIRLVHSIEKGLCLENPRLGFGVKKINTIFELSDKFIDKFGKDAFCLKMAYCAIEEYIQYHVEKGYDHPDFEHICECFKKFSVIKPTEKCGGTQSANTSTVLSFDDINSFFASRHSIRDFSSVDISDDLLTKAIRSAQFAPSACNRQGVRVHVMSSALLCSMYGNTLDGIGGFADSANKFILITGKVSVYDMGEYNQYIVSASIFATYLILSLQSLQIGSCIVQRPLQFSRQWAMMRKVCSIPDDEQLVLMMAVGVMKESYRVPVSKRFPLTDIVSFYNNKKN